MTTSTLAPTSVATMLRGNPATRPEADTTTSARLRASLEAALAEASETVALPVVVRASSLRDTIATLSASPLGRLRGLLVNSALRLIVNGMALDDLALDSWRAWRSGVSDPRMSALFDDLDADQRARLASDVRAHVHTLRTHLEAIPSSWRPRTGVRAHLIMAEGRLQLRDDVDLVLGLQHAATASVVLLDVTTAPLGTAAERLLRYHALVHTVKTGVVPLRTALFSTATGELWTRDVTVEMLDVAVADIVEFINAQAVAA